MCNIIISIGLLLIIFVSMSLYAKGIFITNSTYNEMKTIEERYPRESYNVLKLVFKKMGYSKLNIAQYTIKSVQELNKGLESKSEARAEELIQSLKNKQ